MKYGSFDRREDDEHNGVDLMKISGMFAIQGNFLYGMVPFDRSAIDIVSGCSSGFIVLYDLPMSNLNTDVAFYQTGVWSKQ